MRFGVRDGLTHLRSTSGGAPLRVVRAEPAPVCEAVVVQVRGGLCDRDRWHVVVELEPGARVRLRGAGALVMHRGVSGWRTDLHVSAGARLSWRSPGVILQPGARGAVVTVVEIARGGRVALSEVVDCAAGSVLRTRVVVRRGGVPVHEEWMEVGARERAGPAALGDATHLGTAIVVGPSPSAPPRGDGPPVAWGPVRPGLSVARALGSSLQQIDAVLGPVVETLVA